MNEWEPRSTVTDIGDTARRAAEAGQETASRAGERAQEYAEDWVGRARHQITEMTGRPPEEWTRQARTFVEDNPLKALLMAVGVGYVLGKVLGRG